MTGKQGLEQGRKEAPNAKSIALFALQNPKHTQ